MTSITDNNPLIVTTSAGQVQGIRTSTHNEFLGIPFAEPPVDDLRFQNPVKKAPWDGIFHADHYGAKPPQFVEPSHEQSFTSHPVREDDHWLNLNIYAPHDAHNCPVFVWIYGGAYVWGANSYKLYSGYEFARSGVVFVGINYRTGIEGFAHFPDSPDNRGIADQILALEWVQENIAAFGGNPHNVTIGGESAGSMSVGALLASPKSQGLFHRAIMQSGTPHTVSKKTANVFSEEMAKLLESEFTAEAFKKHSHDDIVHAYRKIAAQADKATNIMTFHPVIDNDIFVEDPFTFLLHNPSPVPLLIGYNAEEFSLWSHLFNLYANVTCDNLPEAVEEISLPRDIAEAYQEYYRGTDKADEVFTYYATDYAFAAPIRLLLQAQSGRAYGYIFSWKHPKYFNSAFHVLEIPFVFNLLEEQPCNILPGPEAPKELAEHMHSVWVNFIEHGKPGWEASEQPGTYYEFDYPIKPFTDLSIDPRGQLIDLWTSLYQKK